MGLFSKKKKAETASTTQVELEDGSKVDISNVIDCIGDSCPRPQLMTKAAMSKAQSGDTIEIQIDNSSSVEAIDSSTFIATSSSRYLLNNDTSGTAAIETAIIPISVLSNS